MDLKSAREKKGLTQMRLSEMSGIHFITLSEYERGIRELKLETMMRLEKILGKVDWGVRLGEPDKYFLVECFREMIEHYPLRRVANFLYRHSKDSNNVLNVLNNVLNHIKEVRKNGST